MPEQKSGYYISTLKGTIIIFVAAMISVLVFGALYFFWIERPASTSVPEIFNLSRVVGVNLNSDLKIYLKHDFCQKDSDCPEDSVCYISRECKTMTTGIVCGAELGDLLCHRKCLDNSDCPKEMPVCEKTNFYINEKTILIRICKPSAT